MSESKLISPMLDNFLMGEPISDSNGVRCYPAINKETEERFIVKIISFPASESQLEALLLSGAYSEKANALAYFKSLSEDILAEISTIEELSKLEGFVPFADHQLVENEDSYDVYILNRYQYTLQKRMRQSSLTHLEAINLGLDLCAALAACRRDGYIYVDLKPSNVYLTEDNSFRIGDLGLMKLSTLKYASLPERYRSQYTAPEVSDAYATLNDTLDVYAAGLILYQVYNNGVLPVADDTQTFAAPAFADYEMAEIILKACAPSPEDRWADPVEFGQAMVDYMQRNGVNDVPITPVMAEESPVNPDEERGAYETDEAERDLEQSTMEDMENTDGDTEEVASTEADDVDTQPEDATTDDIYAVDEEGNVKLLAVEDDGDTLPEDEANEIEYDEVTDEVSDMMQQADELIAHEAPEPVIQPEPIDVPIPAPITQEDAKEETGEPTDDTSEAPDDKSKEADSPAAETTESPAEEATEEENAADEQDEPKTKKSRVGKWVRNILLLILAAAIAVGGFFFYKNYYLQPIEAITLEEGEDGSLTVYVTSLIDESKLTVICSDTYGNQLYSAVTDGKAVFTGLAPNSAYTVRVDISGFHKLIGDVSAAYTTPLQTNIVSFSAVTGSEDTSIILNFTIDGPDSEQWKVTYTADNGEVIESVFNGHTVTLNGFTVGNTYSFTLAPETDIEITGTTEVSYTATKIVKARNLMISSCTEEGLNVSWSAPFGTTVDSWTVRCCSDSDFDETTVTSETNVTFNIPDASAAYTVEVTASGMSVNEKAFASKNAVAITDFTATLPDSNMLNLSWNSAYTPEGGWIMLCSIDGSAPKDVSCDGTIAQFSPVIPGAEYVFTLKTTDDASLYGNVLTHQIPEAEKFSGYSVNADVMEVSMCRTPSYSGWNRYALDDDDYTTQFSVGENASLLVHLQSTYDRSRDEITTLYVIRNESGAVVEASTTSETWQNMWYRNYCELDIPHIPQTAGNYTLDLFFNGDAVTQIPFTITD